MGDKTTRSAKKIKIDHWLSLEDIGSVANGAEVVIGEGDVLAELIGRNHAFFKACVQHKEDVYGVTSGFGGSSHRRLDPTRASLVQNNLTKYHRCGVGSYASYAVGRATMLARLRCLARGRSGVAMPLINQLIEFTNAGAVPAIPVRGSVGASGDLTPLSYLAAVLQGEHLVVRPNGELVETKSHLASVGLTPQPLKDRDALALMNGTSFMCGIATLAWINAERIAEQACRMTGVLCEVLAARTAPFTELLNAQKPHAGQKLAASRILSYLSPEHSRPLHDSAVRGVQDPYSLRCAPQVIGMLFDALSWTRTLIETELNGVSDNPVFIHEEEVMLNGGQFFGGHIAMACDTLKNAVAAVLNLVDRQVALMMDGRYRDTLPESLRAEAQLGGDSNYHHGFKAMQITLSSLAAECAKLSMPMAVFSRPTESSNQDVVSMGTIAARDLETICDLASDGMAIGLLAVRQAAAVGRVENLTALSHLADIAETSAVVTEDRPMDADIVRVRNLLFGNQSTGLLE